MSASITAGTGIPFQTLRRESLGGFPSERKDRRKDPLLLSQLLSPLTLSTSPVDHNGFSHIPSLPDQGDFKLVARFEKEDELVLSALARILNLHFVQRGVFPEKSFSFRTSPEEYYANLVSRGRINILYKINMIESLHTIPRHFLLGKLSHLIEDRYIFSLISSFLECPVLNEDGDNLNRSEDYGIPPAGLISCVLLNFMFFDFDKDLIRVYPGLSYSRYFNEVFASFPLMSLEKKASFEEILSEILISLGLSGKVISIREAHLPLLIKP